MDGNETLTDTNRKRTKGVMVRLPRSTIERIDDYAGDTHSSRPDFITDAIRRYIGYILKESASVMMQIEGLEVSNEAKQIYFSQQMSERIYSEYESYRKSKESESRTKDVSVLISMPPGLQREIAGVVDSTGIFNGNQEFIKVAIYHLFSLLEEEGSNMEFIREFHAMPDRSRVLERELEQIRMELNENQS